MTARVLHLNGPPGVGKSTLARRYADEHPGTLCLDVDVLRTFVGGWRDDFAGTGELVRGPALALLVAWVEGGHDVVLPQLFADPLELARFRQAAEAAGGSFLTVMLWAELAEVVARFADRPVTEPWQVVVAGQTDAAVLADYHRRLAEQVAAGPGLEVVRSGRGEQDAAYVALLEIVRRHS